MWEKRSRILFLSGISIAVVVFFQMAAYLLCRWMGWELQFNFFYLCSMTIRSLGLTQAAFLFDALILYTFVSALWITARQLYLSRRFAGKLKAWLHAEETVRMNRRFRDEQDDIRIVEHHQPLAFTVGFRRPKIVLSTGLLRLLDEEELAAVIYHETYHKRHADPLKTFLLSLFASVFWYIPVLMHIRTNYKMIREVLADHYAMDRTGSAAGLGSALLKLLKKGQTAAIVDVAHVSFADHSINYRIQRILDPKTEIPFFLPTTSVFISLSVVFLLGQLFLLSVA